MKRIAWVAAWVLAAAVPAAGQTVYGPQLSWGDDSDLGIGARLEVPLSQLVTADPGSAVEAMSLIGSFDWFFPDDGAGVDVTYWEINGNLAYALPVENLRPYVGGGLNIAHVSVDFDDEEFPLVDGGSDTDVGLNILGGLKFLLGQLDAFAEARIELGGGEQFVLSAGILFGR